MASGIVKFLQNTQLESTLPYKNSSESVSHLKDATVYVINQQVVEIIDPSKCSIAYMDSIDVTTVKPSTYIVSQTAPIDSSSFFVPCNPLCKKCSGATKDDCTDCHNNFYIENNTCKCPTIGFTLSTIFLKDPLEAQGFRNEITCKSCDTSCLTCNNTGKRNCLSCHSSKYIND